MRVTTHSPRSFSDERGLTVLLGEGERFDFAEYLEFNSVADVRGGHYHREYTERLHVLSGALLAEFIDMSTGSPGGLSPLEVGPGTTVTIPPAVAHRFTAREPTRAIAFGTGSSPLVDRVVLDRDVWEGS